MLPQPDQLSSYHNEQMRAWNEFMYAPMMGVGQPYGTVGKAGPNESSMPVRTTVANNYAGLSTAPATDGTGTQVSGASDIGGGAADGAAGSY
jgi:hypothetical protein